MNSWTHWLLLRQADNGDVYGRHELIDRRKAPTLQAALQALYGDHPPVDARCNRVLAYQVVGGMALPVIVKPPEWPREHQVQPLLEGLAPAIAPEQPREALPWE